VKYNESPLVSVVIPCYNHEKYVQETIQSVIEQDYGSIELIVIDDGSKDNSVEKIQDMVVACKFRFKRFEFRHRSNVGLIATLNEALEWCEGEYFSILASDDQWLSSKVDFQVRYLVQNPRAAGVFGGINIIDDDDVALRKKALNALEKYSFDQVFLSQAFLAAPTALLRIKNIKSVGGFDENFRVEDWYMWLRLTEGGNSTLDCLPQVVANYRRHAANLSKNYKFMLDEQHKILDLYRASSLYKKAEAALIFAAYSALIPHDKLKAVSLIPGFLRLWNEKRFWSALAKIFMPQRVLLRLYN